MSCLLVCMVRKFLILILEIFTRPIMSTHSHYVDKTVLKLGIYPKVPWPAYESYVVNRQEWEVPLEGCTQFKTTLGAETV